MHPQSRNRASDACLRIMAILSIALSIIYVVRPFFSRVSFRCLETPRFCLGRQRGAEVAESRQTKQPLFVKNHGPGRNVLSRSLSAILRGVRLWRRREETAMRLGSAEGPEIRSSRLPRAQGGKGTAAYICAVPAADAAIGVISDFEFTPQTHRLPEPQSLSRPSPTPLQIPLQSQASKSTLATCHSQSSVR